MKIYAGFTNDGLTILFKGNIVHDYGQFEINGGEWLYAFKEDKIKFKLVGTEAKIEMKFITFETPNGEGDSDDFIKEISKIKSTDNPSNYRLIKLVFSI